MKIFTWKKFLTILIGVTSIVMPVLINGKKSEINLSLNSSQNYHHNDTKKTSTFLYRPFALEFTTETTNWNAELYPSQVMASDIKALLNVAHQKSIDGISSENTTGYTFEKMTSNSHEMSPVSLEQLTQELDLSFGPLTYSNFNEYVVDIVKYDDAEGTIDFKVYQSLFSYEIISNSFWKSSNNHQELKKYRAVILPPTKYQMPSSEALEPNSSPTKEDTTIWRLPSAFGLKKVQYLFEWNSDRVIADFIHNFQKTPSTLSEEEIANIFYNIRPNYQSPTRTFSIPKVTITTNANDTTGSLSLTATLPEQYFGEDQTLTRHFFGFKANNVTSGIVLNLVSDAVLISSGITQPLWDYGAGASKVTYVGKTISSLLPSQFLNVDPEKKYNYSFLELFNGVELQTSTHGKQTPIAITTTTQGLTSKTGAIGHLTFNGEASKTGSLSDLPSFEITKIEGLANDQLGVLDLLVSYQSLSTEGTVIDVTPQKISFKGFNRNLDSGETLFFAWNQTLPVEYATQTAKNLVESFVEIGETSGAQNNFSNKKEAKDLVAKFFQASDYVLNKYYNPYDDTNNQGAQVAITEVPGFSDENGKQLPNSVKVEIQFGQYESIKNKTFSQIFSPTPKETTIPVSLQASIRVNPLFVQEKHRFSHLLPSQLKFDNILEMFSFNIPPGANLYTTPIKNATFFYIPNDRLGKMTVAIIFPLFNKIELYEFSYEFGGFAQNNLLQENLVLNHVPSISLSAEFLARNPLDPNSLDEKIILDNLFNNLNPNLFRLLKPSNIKIIQRSQDFVRVEISVNWNELTSGSNQNETQSPNVNTILTQAFSQTKRNNNILHQEEIETNNTAEATDTTTQKIAFIIRGFTGARNNLGLLDQTPIVPDDVLEQNQIIAIGIGLSAGFLFSATILIGFLVWRHFKINKWEYYQTDPEKNTAQKKKRGT